MATTSELIDKALDAMAALGAEMGVVEIKRLVHGGDPTIYRVVAGTREEFNRFEGESIDAALECALADLRERIAEEHAEAKQRADTLLAATKI